MASAYCVNSVGMSSEKFLDCSPTFGWLHTGISFGHDLFDEESEKSIGKKTPSSAGPSQAEKATEGKDIEVSRNDMGDFEFRLDDPVAMLPADELFSDGKLLPLRFGTIRTGEIQAEREITEKSSSSILDRRIEVENADLYMYSPKAPRCSSRLREIFGLRKMQNSKQDVQKLVSLPTKNPNHKYLKYFLHRNHKSSSHTDSSQHLPLLKEIDPESTSLSARLSLSSSSSSGFDHEDLPRLSLDSERLEPISISLNRNPPKIRPGRSRTACKNSNPVCGNHPTGRAGRSSSRRGPTDSKRVNDRGASLDRSSRSSTDNNHSTVRIGRSPTRRAEMSSECTRIRAFSVDSPRMNSSGKVVFHNLGRSSSSPSSFGGGQPKIKPRGMERSYSSNVMVTPVLNVPVCSLRGSSKSGSVFGFSQLFPTTQRRDGGIIRDQMKRNHRTDRVC